MMNNCFRIENGVLISCDAQEPLIVVPDNVTQIGEAVFKGQSWIETIILPEGLRVIGKDSFKGCRKLSQINFPASLCEIGAFAFHRCHSLKNVHLPDTVTAIGAGAFLYCDNMEYISASGVKRFQRQCFANCTSLSEIHLSSSIDISNFRDDIFTGCVCLKKIILNNGQIFQIDNIISSISNSGRVHPIVRAVCEGVYQSMKLEDGSLYNFFVNLKSFELPEGIKIIEKSCFFDKKGIVSVVLPKSLERIRANAFGNCINLSEITIRSSRTEVDKKAFRGCCNLSKINLWDGNTYSFENILEQSEAPDIVRMIGEQILGDFYISGRILMEYRGSEERVTVPKGIRVIGENCFAGNHNIGRVILPDSVTEIRQGAFADCVAMQTIELSENLKYIGRSAFENCFRLLKISLPDKVKEIDEAAFKRCFRLNTFEINSGPILIKNMAFYGCRELNCINISDKTQLEGNMIFYKSGIAYTITEPEEEICNYDIMPYSHCRDSSITCLSITDKVVIGKYAFSGCENLTEVSIESPGSVIGEHAFEKCINLKKVTLNVRSIDKNAFAFCRNLEQLTVTGTDKIGEEAFFGCEKLNSVFLSDSVKHLGNRCFEECFSLKCFPFEKIISIGERAFARCEGLYEIALPSLTVARHAFEDCCFLECIKLCSGTILNERAFFGCTLIKEIKFEDKIYLVNRYDQSINRSSNRLPLHIQEIIGDIWSCFRTDEKGGICKYSGNSVKVRIPDDINAVYDEAFRDKMRLTEIEIPESVSYIGKLAFSGTGWLDHMRKSSKMTVINQMIVDASGCSGTEEIPADTVRICSWAFAGNEKIKGIKFAGNRTITDELAFRNCLGLKKITDSQGQTYELKDINTCKDESLPPLIRRIFSECVNCFKTDENGVLTESTGNIRNLSFVKGITAVADEVYKNCNLLETITLSEDTEYIGKSAFENSKWLRAVGNAGSVNRIEKMAFCGCQNLERIELSDSLEYIGSRAFEHCCCLCDIIIPEGVTDINERTFFRCKSLKSITIPESVQCIKKEAFAFCTSLEKLIIKGHPIIEERAFFKTKINL